MTAIWITGRKSAKKARNPRKTRSGDEVHEKEGIHDSGAQEEVAGEEREGREGTGIMITCGVFQQLLRKKAAEELKREQELKSIERKRIIEERAGQPKSVKDESDEGLRGLPVSDSHFRSLFYSRFDRHLQRILRPDCGFGCGEVRSGGHHCGQGVRGEGRGGRRSTGAEV
jgi:hypothetical protein